MKDMEGGDKDDGEKYEGVGRRRVVWRRWKGEKGLKEMEGGEMYEGDGRK